MTNQKFSKFQAFEHKNAFGIDLIENDESVDIELTPETLKTLSGGFLGRMDERDWVKYYMMWRNEFVFL